MMTYQMILTSCPAPGIALVTLNRPEAANALSQSLAEVLRDAVLALADDSSTRVIILTGAGKHFCAGADLKERRGMTREQWHLQHHALEGAQRAILHAPKPVVAAVNGAALGGGFELALACDFIYAATSATFGLTEATLGIMPGMGGTQLLARAIGLARAKEMLFTGKKVDAQQAHALGFVNRLCDDVMADTLATAQQIAQNAPLSLSAIKRAAQEGIDQPLDQALATELRHYDTLLETQDRQEGISAFNEKRKPRFEGK